MTKRETKMTDKYSQPIKHGGGYVIDEQRGNAAIRSYILPSYQAAMEYRAALIVRDSKPEYPPQREIAIGQPVKASPADYRGAQNKYGR